MKRKEKQKENKKEYEEKKEREETKKDDIMKKSDNEGLRGRKNRRKEYRKKVTGIKIYHFCSGIIFRQLLYAFGDFYLVTLVMMQTKLKRTNEDRIGRKI